MVAVVVEMLMNGNCADSGCMVDMLMEYEVVDVACGGGNVGDAHSFRSETAEGPGCVRCDVTSGD